MQPLLTAIQVLALLAAAMAALPTGLLSGDPATRCELRLRIKSGGGIEYEPCSMQLCGTEAEMFECSNFVYEVQGHSYLRCDCPDPLYSLESCFTLLRDPGTDSAEHLCGWTTCTWQNCERDPLNANWTQPCNCFGQPG